MLLKLTYSNGYNIMILKLFRDMTTIAHSVTQTYDRSFIIIRVKLKAFCGIWCNLTKPKLNARFERFLRYLSIQIPVLISRNNKYPPN